MHVVHRRKRNLGFALYYPMDSQLAITEEVTLPRAAK
jgi:hypothetical protein